jgi:hypothetical protein
MTYRHQNPTVEGIIMIKMIQLKPTTKAVSNPKLDNAATSETVFAAKAETDESVVKAVADTPSVFGRNLQGELLRKVDTREEWHWSHACSLEPARLFKRAGVGTNGIIECTFLSKNAHRARTEHLCKPCFQPTFSFSDKIVSTACQRDTFLLHQMHNQLQFQETA